ALSRRLAPPLANAHGFVDRQHLAVTSRHAQGQHAAVIELQGGFGFELQVAILQMNVGDAIGVLAELTVHGRSPLCWRQLGRTSRAAAAACSVRTGAEVWKAEAAAKLASAA